jgi:hypothetical protein
VLYYSSERPVRPDISEMMLLSRFSTLRFANVCPVMQLPVSLILLADRSSSDVYIHYIY